MRALACRLYLAIALCFPVAALEAPAGDAKLLELPFEDLLEVKIRSAGKREEEIRDIPASVTILTREDIQRYGWVTFEELLRNVPGFFVLDTIDERLIGNRGTVGGGIQFLVNGVQQHQTRQKALTIPEIAHLNIPVESIDRIEVIRGPMSTIYGNNAFLGVINVVTNEIGANGSRLSVSGGSRDSGRLFARVGNKFDDGFVALNAGAYRTEGLDGNYADMLDASQRAGLAPGMHRSLDGDVPQLDTSLDLSAGWGEWTTNLRWTHKDYGFYAFTPSFDDGNQARLDTWHAALGWEHAITETLGFRANTVVSEERVDAYEFDFLSPALEGNQQMQNRRWDLELNLLWDPLPTVNLLAGYRFRLLDDIENSVSLSPLLDLKNSVGSFATHDLFSELGWRPFDSLRLTGGLRLSRLPDAYHYTSNDFQNGTFFDKDYRVDEQNLLTWRVSALWSLDEHQVLKLIWGTAAQDNDQIQFTEPERIETAELAYVWTHPAWTLSASLFRNRISNLVRVIQRIDGETGTYQPFDDNSGEWTTLGTEWIGELHPWPELNLSASATWQQTQDEKSGIDPGYSPALLVKLKADYTWRPMTYAVYAHYVDNMQTDWDFVSGSTPGLTRRIGAPVDGYWNLGMNLRYRHPGSGFYANFNASNLLNTEIRYPAKELADFGRGLIGPGRILIGTIGWEF